MSGGDLIVSFAAYPVVKGTELYPFVTEKIGTWCTAFVQFFNGIGDNPVVILFLKGNNLQRDIIHGADLPGIGQILLPGTVPQKREIILKPDFEIIGGYVMSLFLQQCQGDRAVDPSG